MQTSNADRIQPPVNDMELDGSLNRASSNRAQFELLLSMLESDFLERPSYDNADSSSIYVQDVPVSYYRNPPLCADQSSWHKSRVQKQLLHSDLPNALLWSSLHPQPLALKNDPNQLDDEVISNCAINIQRKLRPSKTSDDNKHIAVDETGLYDILQSMQ